MRKAIAGRAIGIDPKGEMPEGTDIAIIYSLFGGSLVLLVKKGAREVLRVEMPDIARPLSGEEELLQADCYYRARRKRDSGVPYGDFKWEVADLKMRIMALADCIGREEFDYYRTEARKVTDECYSMGERERTKAVCDLLKNRAAALRKRAKRAGCSKGEKLSFAVAELDELVAQIGEL